MPSTTPLSSLALPPNGSHPPGPHHTVGCLDLHAHLWHVALRVHTRQAPLTVSLPVWIPGSYLVREFSQHLQRLRAHCQGQPLAVVQTHKNRWRIDPPPTLLAQALPQGLDIHIEYEIYAHDASVRTAWLDAERGFFNGTSLLLRVHGQDHLPQRLRILPPDEQRWPQTRTWTLATALHAADVDERGFGTYHAPHYAALVDEPVALGALWSADFEVRGTPHRLVLSGAPSGFDGERLLADTQRICQASIDFWHGSAEQPPFDRYLFLVHASYDGYGGLEHPHSTALLCARRDLPLRGAAAPLKVGDGYVGLLGLIAHEYFHAWNVKRLRPAELAQPDLERENLTSLLWWFEGLTSYFDDLLLLRAGLIDTTTYLGLLAKTIQQVAQTPGRHIHSLAQSSLEAWTKFYRPGENTPNATVSYYAKGALLGLCLDLSLRQHGQSLDALLRAAWQHSAGGPIDENTLLLLLQRLAGQSLSARLHEWVHGTQDLPVLPLLRQAGIGVQLQPPSLAQRLGLRLAENTPGLLVRSVLRGSVAERAGICAGDEWLAVASPATEAPPADAPPLWRIHQLDDLLPLLREPADVPIWVSRDRRILPLNLSWPGHTPGRLDDDAFWAGHATLSLQPASATAPWPPQPSPPPSLHP